MHRTTTRTRQDNQVLNTVSLKNCPRSQVLYSSRHAEQILPPRISLIFRTLARVLLMPWGVFSMKLTSLTGRPWLLSESATWTGPRQQRETLDSSVSQFLSASEIKANPNLGGRLHPDAVRGGDDGHVRPPEVMHDAEQNPRGPRHGASEGRVAPDVIQLVANTTPRKQSLEEQRQDLIGSVQAGEDRTSICKLPVTPTLFQPLLSIDAASQ